MMKSLAISTLVCCGILNARAQQVQQPKPPADQNIEVLRVSTDLVQTDVMVFDKAGHFVEGLQPSQFDLRVNGKSQAISFFDRVLAGSSKEERQLSTVRKGAAPTAESRGSAPAERGRTIIFFIDDLHLSAASVQRTRQAILQFVEREMGLLDQVAIASASGQIGFLQQFTDNKGVLRAAVARLTHHPYTVVDAENITLTEYAALKVDQGDRDAIDYYTNQLLRATNFSSPGGSLGPPPGQGVGGGGSSGGRPSSGGLSRQAAERIVKQRAQGMLKQASAVSFNTLAGLESLMRSSAQLPGRKLVFFVSDGFYLNDRNTGFVNKLHQITDAALRAGVVIYSLDARGLTNFTDTTSNRADPDGKLMRSNIGELSASQDALNALAEDTGGRALLNSDAINGAVSRALYETSNYYLLAWRPAAEEQKSNFKQINVSIVGRPELVVRLPKGYLESDAQAAITHAEGDKTRTNGSKVSQPVAKTADSDLGAALGSFAPRRGLTTDASASFLDTPNNGLLLNASVQIATAPLDYGPDGKQAASVDLAGVILNDQGKPAASFKTRLTVNPLPANVVRPESGVIYTYKTPLGPGLYQLRAAAQDKKSGKVGSAMQWIEIPDLASHRLTLSSLLLGGQVVGALPKKNEEAASLPQVQFSVDRRFTHSAQLSFWIFVYNAARGSGNAGPDLTAQVQVFRRDQVVVSTPPRKLATEGMADPARIPYGGQFPLATLPAGGYELQVTISDRLANTSASQRVSFQIE